MLLGWVELIRKPFGSPKTDFVSVDARRFSNNPKTYELITSPPPTSSMPKTPEAVVTSPPSEYNGLSPLPQSPRSLSSQYTTDYFSKDGLGFGKEVHSYASPKLSFSTPRPPSAGRISSRESTWDRQFPAGRETPTLTFSPSSNPPARSFSRTSNQSSVARSHTPAIEWDPVTSYAPSSEALSKI